MIEIDQLEYVHPGGVPALRGIQVTLAPEQCTALMGPNGSGKTTLARCLNGLLTPSSGTVSVDGVEVTESSLPDIRRRVAMVFQNPDDALVAPTVETDIAFGLENLGLPPAQMRERVQEILEAFHLERYREHPPHLLSGGERQRLAVASAIAVRPDYLILDEPTALLDPGAREEPMLLIGKLAREEGLGILHITQSPEEAAMADRLLLLNDGQLVGDGAPRTIFSDAPKLDALRLAVPFSVDCAMAAAGSAVDALHLAELSDWLTTNFDAPAPGNLAVVGVGDGAGRKERLEARQLSHQYTAGVASPVAALEAVDLSITAGSIHAVVGPSGSGKTTLVQHLNALLRPSSGTVLLDGEDIWADGNGHGARRRVGLVFQFPEAQLFEETIAEDVAFGPNNHGCSPEESRRRTDEALDRVGLPRAVFGNRSPMALSGGERRRAAIAGVLAIGPEVLILDEPTAGLDPANEKLVAGLLTELAAAGCSVVLVSHDMDRVAELATDITVLQEGRVRWHGDARRVLESAAASGTDSEQTIEAPTALRLCHTLRSCGWQVPSLLTRQEACHFVRSLRRRSSSTN